MLTLTVSQVNRYVGSLLRGDKNLQSFLVRGEITDFIRHPRSGHMYFTLRDKESGIKSVMFRTQAQRLRFLPREGMEVVALASAALYEKEGSFQLYVTDLQPLGAGAQMLAFEELRRKLTALGVFDPAAKRPLPPRPMHIGVVTSDSGAALRDIQNVLSRRFPIAVLHLYPAAVQGVSAPNSISRAIQAAGAGPCEVLIVGRGGGSAEDLSAFQTEEVVLAIFNCPKPVISAVGHETDWTLADFAADARAPTPSAAAELAVPDVAQLCASLHEIQDRLTSAMADTLQQKAFRLSGMQMRLQARTPVHRQQMAAQNLVHARARLLRSGVRIIENHAQKLQQASNRLEMRNPLKILGQGYALAYHGKTLLRDSSDVKPGDVLHIRLEKGSVDATVLSAKTE